MVKSRCLFGRKEHPSYFHTNRPETITLSNRNVIQVIYYISSIHKSLQECQEKTLEPYYHEQSKDSYNVSLINSYDFHRCALTKHAYYWVRAYKARLQGSAVGWRAYKARLQFLGVWSALTKPACSFWEYGARLQSPPAVFGSMERASKARLPWGMPAGEVGDGALTKPACSFWEYGVRLQSTPAVGVCQQVRSGMARLQSPPAVFGSMECAYKARLQWGYASR